MDRETLAAMLEEGRSIESIARETGRSASTVAYWVNKHGLVSRHAPKHAARGGIEREQLAGAGRGRALDPRRSRRLRVSAHDGPALDAASFELSTPRRADSPNGAARRAARRPARVSDPRAGPVRPRGRPAASAARVAARRPCIARRRDVKGILVDEAGGRCVLLRVRPLAGGAALPPPSIRPTKAFALTRQGVTRSLAAARAEAAKCVLLCSNCHAVVEAGTAVLPAATTMRPRPFTGPAFGGSSIGRAFGC